jgi:CBS domain-containing protein
MEQLIKPSTVQEIMTPSVLVVPESMTAGELATFLTDNEISGAPVIDSRGHAVGVVSLSDLARVASEEGMVSRDHSSPTEYLRGRNEESEWLRGWEESYDREDMERLHVTEETRIPDVARLMVLGHLHRVLVLRDGKVVGIVSSMDLLELLAEGVQG